MIWMNLNQQKQHLVAETYVPLPLFSVRVLFCFSVQNKFIVFTAGPHRLLYVAGGQYGQRLQVPFTCVRKEL
jgi:hypothetical protein